MTKQDFLNANVRAGDKATFLRRFNSAEPMAYFLKGKTCYYAGRSGGFGPIFQLAGTGQKYFRALPNHDISEPGEWGVANLVNITIANKGPAQNFANDIIFKEVAINVADTLKQTYKVVGQASGLVDNLQSESASVKKEGGGYASCGTRTVHRLYLATVFAILRHFHGADTRDNVVAMIVGRDGRILSWGRKNPAVPCWHGETSAVMALGGVIPSGSVVYSTLKPCEMCAGTINDASSGNARVYWGQDDPTGAALRTVLDDTRMGSMLDGNKTQQGARGILLGSGADRTSMATALSNKFAAQKNARGGIRSTIDYIMTDEAQQLVLAAETYLASKVQKYAAKPPHFNTNTDAVIGYLLRFMGHINLPPSALGV
jgi:tRNA(Arg) A34 adenosine deaminase TadA